MKSKRFSIAALSATAMVLLILDGKTALQGGMEGVELCLRSLIPSLFPFLVVSDFLTGSLMGSQILLLRPLGRLFRITSGSESLLIPGFLGGYPAGAQAIGQAYRDGKLSEKSAKRLILFCNNAGPAFLFGVVGNIVTNRGQIWAIWGTQIISSILCSWIIPYEEENCEISTAGRVDFPGSVSTGIHVMSGICGWVVLFRVILTFFEKWLLWSFPAEVRTIITGTLELTNGCLILAGIEDPRLRFVLCSATISFGGICVAMQTAQVINPLPIQPYILWKLLQSVLCLLISAALQYRLPLLLPVAAALCWLLKKTVAKRQNVVYNMAINLRRNPYAVS